jgi:hypothetical protein
LMGGLPGVLGRVGLDVPCFALHFR